MIAANPFSYIPLLGFLMLAQAGTAQVIKSSSNKYYVEHFGEKEGLLQNTIYSILPDNNDFLWIGTDAGITRFNGHRFLPVEAKAGVMKNNFTRVFLMYNKGEDTILAFSYYYHSIATIIKGKITNIETQQVEKQGMLFQNLHYTVPPPSYIKGTSHTASSTGMNDWNAGTGKFVGGVYNKDTFWVVLKNAIGVFNSKGLVCKIVINNIKPERVQFVNHQIIYIDEDNYVNFYTPFGRLQKKEPLGIVSKHNLTFFCNRFGDNFFCVADSFLYRISQAKSGRLKIEELISNLQKPEDISTVYEKDSDLIVTGTLREGLYVYKKNSFLTTAPLTNGESDIFYSQQLLSDSQTIFAGNGLLFKNNRYVGKISGCCNKYIYGLLKDRKGYYWYATNGYIFRSLKIGVSPDTIKTDAMGHPDIFLEDREGRVWFIADEQLGYYENGKITNVQIKNLHSPEISIIKQDFIGRYYIGTHKGLFIWEHIGDSLGKKIPELQSYDIRFVLPEKNGLTWVSTYGNGIFLITKNGVTSFPENNGRLAYVHCFIEDAKGYFWMPTNHGLLVTTKKSLIEYSRDNKNFPFFYSFSTNNGLRTNEFNGGTEPPFLRLPNGDISLPSMEGLVRFNPSAINFNFSASPIFIDNILLDNADIGDSNGFDVSNKVKNIGFSISSSFWGNLENDLLEYQLIEKGYAKEHDQWLPVDELNKINLFSPSHGYYQLLIRKRKGFGKDDYVYKTINFHVLPKWYETEAFFLAILIAIIFIMLVILSLRRNYYQRANQILKKKVDVATIELKQMNNTLEKKVEERTLEIQQQQIKFKTLVEHSSAGVYIVQDDKFIYVNPRFEEILGYEPDEAIGMNALMLFDEEDRKIVAEKIRRRMSGEVESEHYEIAARKKDGTRCQLELFGSRTIYEGKPTIIGTMLNITEKKLLEQKVTEQKIQEQKKVIRAILIGEEKERNKIGQELHDNINQILAGTKLYLSIIEHDKLGSENIIKQSMQLLDSAIEEIRALSKYKVTPAKKVDLQEMLQGLIDLFHDTTKIDTDFNYSGSAQLMDDDLKLNIYRIIQEQLNNILKHAQAKKISIMVEAGEKNIRMFVADDGKGFDVESKKKGIGVANMINRVESFNGTINIQSSPDNGCKIKINLPV